jgi:hypothetical protein
MGYGHGTKFKEFKSLNGTHSADIVARNDGLFQVYEYRMSSVPPERWLIAKVSGLYQTAEAAEAMARASLGLE